MVLNLLMGNRIVELKERVHSFVENRGPILPSTVAQEFRSTTLFISALLSELVTEKKVKLTRAKIGGSPLYYAPHQAEKLADLLRGHIGDKHKEALDLLKEKDVLRDRDLLPFERIALRELGDFAKPVRLVIQDTEEIFWKWYLFPDEEAKSMIASMLEDIYSPESKKKKPVVNESKVQAAIEEAEKNILQKPTEIGGIDIKKKQIAQTRLVKKSPEKEEVIKVKAKRIKSKRVKKKEIEIDLNIDEHFEKIVIKYLKKKKIKVLDKTTIRKEREMNYIVSLPSAAGELRYFVKARKKKKLNEGDLLLAFTEGQDKKLPTIVISNAEISKKVRTFITKSLPGLTYIKFE